MTPNERLTAGTVLRGRYELRVEVGRGAVATVWRAHDRETGEAVAVKHARQNAPVAAAAWLDREADVLARIRRAGGHSNVVALHDTLDLRGDRAIVTRYVPGFRLDDLVDRTGAVDPPLVRRVGDALADAAALCHDRGVILRNLRPADVLLDGDAPVIVDLNAAVFADGPAVDAPVAGPFTAPEARTPAGDPPCGPRSDVYALGRLVAFLATGRRRRGSGGPDPAGESAGSLSAVVARATRPDPEDRFDSVAAFRRALTAEA